MRIVLDTNILVRAHANARGPARELLLLVVAAPEHTLLLSPFVLQELERVFGYERVRSATKLTLRLPPSLPLARSIGQFPQSTGALLRRRVRSEIGTQRVA